MLVSYPTYDYGYKPTIEFFVARRLQQLLTQSLRPRKRNIGIYRQEEK